MEDHGKAGVVQGVDKTAQATSSSAHSRINVPLNLENWGSLEKGIQDDLLWFHQHLLDNHMGWEDASEAIGYERSVVFKVLKGIYEGNYSNVCKAIQSYKRIADTRGTIQSNEIVDNGISQMVSAGLDYALANNSITTVIGESRMGKSVAAKKWRDENNHGRSVYVVAPAYGGTKALLRRIADAVGVNKNMSSPQLLEALGRAFNKNRILIVDEAHRLLPGDRRTNPVNIEILRDLYNDGQGCALALISTQRFDDELRKAHYQFEQVLGRIGMPIRLPKKIRIKDFRPIVQQYIKDPSDKLIQAMDQIANNLGRLGILVETLKVASRIANKSRQTMSEEHVWKAMALRKQMMGESQEGK